MRAGWEFDPNRFEGPFEKEKYRNDIVAIYTG